MNVNAPSATIDHDFARFDVLLHDHAAVMNNPSAADPLGWWRANEHAFPLLAQEARHFFTLLASSASAERAFSTAGWIVSNR